MFMAILQQRKAGSQQSSVQVMMPTRDEREEEKRADQRPCARHGSTAGISA